MYQRFHRFVAGQWTRPRAPAPAAGSAALETSHAAWALIGLGTVTSIVARSACSAPARATSCSAVAERLGPAPRPSPRG
jgi:hypothetical protein